MERLLQGVRAILCVIVVVMLALLFATVFVRPSQGNPGDDGEVARCDLADRVASKLESAWGEYVILLAHIPETRGRPPGVLQIFANEETGTWSAVVTVPNESVAGGLVSCVSLAGDSWTHLRPVRRDSE